MEVGKEWFQMTLLWAARIDEDKEMSLSSFFRGKTCPRVLVQSAEAMNLQRSEYNEFKRVVRQLLRAIRIQPSAILHLSYIIPQDP